jgi:hypothetical protein
MGWGRMLFFFFIFCSSKMNPQRHASSIIRKSAQFLLPRNKVVQAAYLHSISTASFPLRHNQHIRLYSQDSSNPTQGTENTKEQVKTDKQGNHDQLEQLKATIAEKDKKITELQVILCS